MVNWTTRTLFVLDLARVNPLPLNNPPLSGATQWERRRLILASSGNKAMLGSGRLGGRRESSTADPVVRSAGRTYRISRMFSSLHMISCSSAMVATALVPRADWVSAGPLCWSSSGLVVWWWWSARSRLPFCLITTQ